MLDADREKGCCGCGACENVCPQDCISLELDEKGFYRPVVKRSKCVSCNRCNEVCPYNKFECSNEIQRAFAFRSLKAELLMQSSSGGIFGELAIEVIRLGGVVIGVAFSENFMSAEHVIVERYEDIYKLYGSKYIQSKVGDIYRKVESFLEKKKLVLFSGTPCQIAGLKNYLKTNTNKLLCVAVVCHGVGSLVYWEKYLNNIKTKIGNEIVDCSFRYKDPQRPDLHKVLTMYIQGRKRYVRSINTDAYLKVFNDFICVNPTCNKCIFQKNESRQADITIGDFWMPIDEFLELKDKFGNTINLSLVFAHSIKGMNLLGDIFQEVNSVEIDYTKALKNPGMLSKEWPKNKKRQFFWEEVNTLSFKKIQRKYVIVTWKDLLRQLIIDLHLWKLFDR